MNPKRNLDELLRQSLENYESGLPAPSWKTFRESREKRKKRRGAYWLIAAGFAVLCGAGLVWHFQRPVSSSPESLAENKVQEQQKPLSEQETSLSGKKESVQELAVSPSADGMPLRAENKGQSSPYGKPVSEENTPQNPEVTQEPGIGRVPNAIPVTVVDPIPGMEGAPYLVVVAGQPVDRLGLFPKKIKPVFYTSWYAEMAVAGGKVNRKPANSRMNADVPPINSGASVNSRNVKTYFDNNEFTLTEYRMSAGMMQHWNRHWTTSLGLGVAHSRINAQPLKATSTQDPLDPAFVSYELFLQSGGRSAGNTVITTTRMQLNPRLYFTMGRKWQLDMNAGLLVSYTLRGQAFWPDYTQGWSEWKTRDMKRFSAGLETGVSVSRRISHQHRLALYYSFRFEPGTDIKSEIYRLNRIQHGAGLRWEFFPRTH